MLLQLRIEDLFLDWTFLVTIFSYVLILEELTRWARNGKRSELSDIVVIFFFFFLIMFFTKDLLTSIMGAFAIYLWFGIYELKDYPVLNKVLMISLVTYNIIFIAGIISSYIGNPFLLNTTFAFSFWIILILGFLLFGRKYIVIWRFMSPEYLTLFLYIIAWLVVVFIDQYTPFKFILYEPVFLNNFQFLDFVFNIYIILIAVNWLVYFISGPILDFLLGIKRVKDKNLIDLVSNVKTNLKIKGNVKVGFGKYPILNAMAYGSVFDKRIALIAEDYKQIPKDEMKGIVSHELAHTKGKHTLILALITSLDLLIRMFIGIPATFYDYTFGNPRMPLLAFILLNFGIYIFLYIFVRILEGRADLKAKEAGYAFELTKALYTLESFYASGREIGLNTMLLCDEKINQNNKIMDYFETARYLHDSMIKPSRFSLLSNMVNSHPPTYHRIAALMGDNLKPEKEAFLPFLLLNKKNIQKSARLFDNALQKFKEIANKKFNETFDITSVSDFLSSINRKELYRYELKKFYIFKNKISGELTVGKLLDVKFLDDICSPDVLFVQEYKTQEKLQLNASLYIEKNINFNEQYYLDKKSPLLLSDIQLNEKKNNIKLIFKDLNGSTSYSKFAKNPKLPPSINSIAKFKNQDLFLKKKGIINVVKCIDVLPDYDLEKYQIILKNQFNESIYKFNLKQLIIRPQNIFLAISKSKSYRMYESELINWLIKSKIRTVISLKKPVNNIEIGYLDVINLEVDEKNIHNLEDDNFLEITNIFKEKIKIPYKQLDHLTFQYKTALLIPKSEESFITKIGYKFVKRIKPESIFYLNKV
jgi:Zn-dependent protease with chaperone function